MTLTRQTTLGLSRGSVSTSVSKRRTAMPSTPSSHELLGASWPFPGLPTLVAFKHNRSSTFDSPSGISVILCCRLFLAMDAFKS